MSETRFTVDQCIEQLETYVEADGYLLTKDVLKDSLHHLRYLQAEVKMHEEHGGEAIQSCIDELTPKRGRYLIFGGSHCYSIGGMHDFVGSSDSIKEATSTARRLAGSFKIEWWHIYDTREGQCVSDNGLAPHGTEYSFPSMEGGDDHDVD